jgi:nucleoside-diphosphate-sugar epimerase
VTGGEGFIGSHLVERLLREGAEVRALVHYSPSGRVGWLEGRQDDVDIVQGDVRDGSRVRRAVEGRDVVFHLAALIGIPYSYEAPESYVQTNIVGTQNILDACRSGGSCTRRPARSTAPPGTSRSTRPTPCSRSRRTRPPRSAPT